MATWEDLDNELGSDKDEAEDEANVAMRLVATVPSDAEPETLKMKMRYTLRLPELNLLSLLKSVSHTLKTYPMS